MPIALEITLIALLAAIGLGLVPLLFQLRRTARNLDTFLLATRKDLTQIAGDVQASRARMDFLAVTLQRSLDDLSPLVRILGEAGCSLMVFRDRARSFIASASRNFGGLSGGISMVLALFDHWQSTRTPRQEKPS